MAERDGSMDDTLVADEVCASTPPTPPATIVAGRYEILGLLGTGGMGRVYRARDRELGEEVALKVLHRLLVSSEPMVERFRQEVRLARKVTHRNVARTFDIGEHDGEKFLTMELVHGAPLSARLERGAMPVDDAIATAREILAGVAAAHAAGVVHRDLKPDNVLVERGGRVVVTDFGIARAELPDAAGRTGGGAVGTPAYMAPEQLGGQTVDVRADIYAFGAVLFEMLTGRRAWPGTSPLAVAAARLTEPPPDPRASRPALSPQLAAIVLKCLARNREDRFATCADVDRALGAMTSSGLQTDSAAATAAAPRVTPTGSERERTVAVMPFRNLGPPEDAYFAAGLAEDLVDALSVVRGLRVRGRGYSDPADLDVVDTGRRLGVDVVADGSIRRAGDLLRVSARLVGVADGFQLWSSRFERPSGGAFLLNDEVATAIARALATERDGPQRPQPTDPIAIDLYFRARQAMLTFWEPNKQSEAVELFRQALARAPDDPTILAGHVHAQLGRNVMTTMDPLEALTLARRALVSGPRLPDPWVALAAVRYNQNDDAAGAIRALRRALELGPSHADAHDRAGRLLLEANAWDDAIAHLERAIWLDPTQSWARIDRMRAAALLGDWTLAQAVSDAGAGEHWKRHREMHRLRMWSWTGAPEVPFPDVSAGLRPELRAMQLGYARAREMRSAGHVATRADFSPQLLELATTAPSARARRFIGQMLAEHAAMTGSHALALEMLRGAVDAGLQDLSWLARLAMLDPLRGDPAFQELSRVVEERASRVTEAWRGPTESLDAALASLS